MVVFAIVLRDVLSFIAPVECVLFPGKNMRGGECVENSVRHRM